MQVCVGGTFHPFHKGHRELLKKALVVAGKKGSIYIGITTDEVAHKKKNTAPFKQRKKNLIEFFKEENALDRVSFHHLKDSFGPAVQRDFDAIVVSPETQPTAEQINVKRAELGKKPLQIICIPFVLASDKKPISSTRIRKKEIDENGRILPEE